MKYLLMRLSITKGYKNIPKKSQKLEYWFPPQNLPFQQCTVREYLKLTDFEKIE
jgi:hypothetical protein